MERKDLFYLGIVIGLFFISSTPKLSSATLVWSESFDAIDFGIWTTESCKIVDGRLRGMEIDSTHSERKTLSLSETIWAYRNNTVSVGTWKFDLEEI